MSEHSPTDSTGAGSASRTGNASRIGSAARVGRRRPGRGDLIGFGLLIVALVLFPIVAPSSLVNLGIYALIYGIAAIGLSLLMGLAGQVSLGHAAFFSVGAYVFAILTTKYSVFGPLAALIAVIASMVVALIVGMVLLRLRGHFLALATLGLGIIVTVVATELTITGGTSGIFGISKPEFNGRVYDSAGEFFYLVAPFVVIAMFLARNLSRSRTGRALSAVNDSETAAECLGVNTYALRVKVFVIAAGFAAVAGVFYAMLLGVVSPDSSSFELSVEFLLMVVLGGLASVWGALIGAVVVLALDELMRTVIPILVPSATGEIQLIGFGVVLVALVVLLPGGLVQAWRALVGRFRSASSVVDAEPDSPEPGVGSAESDRNGATATATTTTATTTTTTTEDARSDPMRTADDLPERGSVVLTVAGLTKRFGGVVAVDDVDLDVRAGEILALIGPNGAGKTTCFNMITGVIAPTQGRIDMLGKPVHGRRPHVIAALGATRTFQNLQVFTSTTVRGNAAVGRHLRSRSGVIAGMLGLARAEQRAVAAAADEFVSALGLSDVADNAAGDLPFGRQRLLEVARALATEPALLLLDEPMAGLSGAERQALGTLLRRLRAAGIAVMLVEHDVSAVMALADRVAVLDDGRLIALGTPAQVQGDKAVIAAYLGTDEHDEQVLAEAAEELG